MNVNETMRQMREEFSAKLDGVMVEELRKLQLDEATKKEIAETLPEIIIPKLTAAEEKKANDLIKKLDGKIEKMAELAAEIGTTATQYNALAAELRGSLMGKDHKIIVRHSGARVQSILNIISRIVAGEIANGVGGFRAMPDKDSILKRLTSYNGM